MTAEIRDRASAIEPAALSSLASIHLATAEVLRPGLGVLLTYDDELLTAALERRLPALSPS